MRWILAGRMFLGRMFLPRMLRGREPEVYVSRGWPAKIDGNCFIQDREVSASVMKLDGNAQSCVRDE